MIFVFSTSYSNTESDCARRAYEIDCRRSSILLQLESDKLNEFSPNRDVSSYDFICRCIIRIGKNVKKIDLSWLNSVDDLVCYYISEMLRYNSTLIELNLSHTEITDVGAKALAIGLAENKTLLNLTFSKFFNKVKDKTTIDKINKYLSRNQTIRKNKEDELSQALDADAQYHLGMKYHIGEGVATDYVFAVECLKKAAAKGHSWSQYTLGGMYKHGQGMAADHEKAREWFHLAASQGNAPAQYNLGKIYEEGLTVEKNVQNALLFYKQSAEQGYEDAKLALEKLTQNLKEDAAETAKTERGRYELESVSDELKMKLKKLNFSVTIANSKCSHIGAIPLSGEKDESRFFVVTYQISKNISRSSRDFDRISPAETLRMQSGCNR